MNRNQQNRISNKTNDEISSKMVRIVNIIDWLKPEEHDDCEQIQDVYPLKSALELAESQETDLIEIAVSKDTSICKLMDLDKFIYQEKKKAKAAKQAQKKSDQKEIKLSVDIAENDLSTKERHAREFLKKGNRVKVSLQIRGRRRDSQFIKDSALALVLSFVDRLSDVGKASELPVWQGPRVFVQINPK